MERYWCGQARSLIIWRGLWGRIDLTGERGSCSEHGGKEASRVDLNFALTVQNFIMWVHSFLLLRQHTQRLSPLV